MNLSRKLLSLAFLVALSSLATTQEMTTTTTIHPDGTITVVTARQGGNNSASSPTPEAINVPSALEDPASTPVLLITPVTDPPAEPVEVPPATEPATPVLSPFVRDPTVDPFAEQSYRRSAQGAFDFSFTIGLGVANFEGVHKVPGQYGLPLSFDLFLGFGYFGTDLFSFGLETGVVLNWAEDKWEPFYKATELERLGVFWNYATPDWLNYYGLTDTRVGLRYINVEIPLRLYFKLSLDSLCLGSVYRDTTLQGFTGVDLSLTNISTNFYRGSIISSDYAWAAKEDSFQFVPNFVVGARWSYLSLYLEYSYHLALIEPLQRDGFYAGRAHRLSTGLSFNIAVKG